MGLETELFLAIPGKEILATRGDLASVRDTIDRQQNGGYLPQAVAVMIEDWGLGESLHITLLEGMPGNEMQGPIRARQVFRPVLHARGNALPRCLRGVWQFEDEGQAALAAAWLQEQQDPEWRSILFGGSERVDQWPFYTQGLFSLR